MKNELLLKNCEEGRSYTISCLGIDIRKKLLKMGLYCGMDIKLNKLNEDDSAVVTVGNQKISLGTDIVEHISVTNVGDFTCKNNKKMFRRRRH